jgi:hypothetical protein
LIQNEMYETFEGGRENEIIVEDNKQNHHQQQDNHISSRNEDINID